MTLYQPVIDKSNLRESTPGATESPRWVITIPEHANIAADTVGRFARETPEHIALVYEDRDGHIQRWSYRELDRAATQLALKLRALGVQCAEPVAVHSGQTPTTAIAHMAVYKLGAVVLTLSQLYGPDTIAHVLNDARPAILITESQAWAPVRAVRAKVPSLKQVIVDEDPEGTEIALPDCLQADPGDFEPVRTHRDDPALLMYTSGSTGMPKGMLHAHRIIHAYLPTLTLVYNLELDLPDQVFWSPADWAWVGGLLDLALPAWQCGQTVVASQHRFSPQWAFEFMARHNVTHSFMTPTALKRLAEIPAPRKHWDLAIRVICTGGESLPGDVIRWADESLGIVCNEFYGLTEFNHMVGNCRALYPIVPGSMGRAFPGRTVAIIDHEGEPQPDGTVGEIASRHAHDPSLFLGYWGDPGVPERMRLGEWLRSGDLALRTEDGYFWYQGRNDDLIKSAGYRIGPAEVEDALVRHGKVAEAAVIGKPDPERGAIVKAFVRLMPEIAPSEALISDLQAFVKANLAVYKYPREIEFVDSFPLTSSGKIRRKALREAEIAQASH